MRQPFVKTRLLSEVSEAAELLRLGGLVAFPTETVIGLGADATNVDAIERLFKAKGRPSDNPLIVHLAKASQWQLAGATLSKSAKALLDAFAPGPITVVIPKNDQIVDGVTAGLDTVGIRVPEHPFAEELLCAAGVPVAAPSANRSGRPSCTLWRSVLEDLEGFVDGVMQQDASGYGIESTVVDCCGEVPVLLRPGAICLEQLREVLPETRTLEDVSRDDLGKSSELANQNVETANSPGLRHPHYQPNAEVSIWQSGQGLPPEDGRGAIAFAGVSQTLGADFAFTKNFSSVEEYAAGFYEFLRECDRRKMAAIVCEMPPASGIGIALGDRLRRAAAR